MMATSLSFLSLLFFSFKGCGSLIRGEDLARHLSTECPKRIVPCPLGCPETGLWAEEVEAHVRTSCPLSMAPCRANCGMHVAAIAQQDHEERDCPERMVTCQCGAKHAFSKTEEHKLRHLRASCDG